MLRKILFAVSLTFVFGANVLAQAAPAYDARLAGSRVYSDPGFQEFIETSYGYLNPRNKAHVVTDFRDSVASPAPARKAVLTGAKAGKYVFVSIRPKAGDYSGLLRELSASAGFVLSGERISYKKNAKKTRLLGWVPAEGVSAIRRNPGVAGLRLLRKAGRESFVRARGF